MPNCLEDGWILPLIDESGLSIPLRLILYFVGLLWCLVGIAIIVEVPLAAIEVITSISKTELKADPDNPGKFKKVQIPYWNGAVANMTLIAFGTAIPKIMLATIEIIASEFYSGELGTATIVGSSAFSLLFITGVCIMVIPSPKTRYIKKAKPYFILVLVFSLFAYLWVFISLTVISPQVIELWEAFLTLTLYPVLVLLVYIIDNKYRRKKVSKTQHWLIQPTVDKNGDPLTTSSVNARSIASVIKDAGGSRRTVEEAAAIATVKANAHIRRSAAWYYVGATRNVTGSERLIPQVKPKSNTNITGEGLGEGPFDGSVVEFSSPVYAIHEHEKRVSLKILRKGNNDKVILFRFETISGTAEAGVDFVARRGVLIMEAGQRSLNLDIEIIDDNTCEPNESFYVKLCHNDDSNSDVKLGKQNITEIKIMDNDGYGLLEFDKPTYLFKENIGIAQLPIMRKSGAKGRVSVKWRTTDKTAIHRKDYEGGEGEVVFEHGETKKMLHIRIIDDQQYEKDEKFEVELSAPRGGAGLGKVFRTTVTILNDDEYRDLVDKTA
uniref:Sodium/calcium exchanger 1-like n=1 Tax=Saccoglossus kowalevskii TaxID=10224 RepID=A0ABM0ME24_SACKO|nr:PREDICTED: sodium/calcium exchanger 1-like [Saccoglossus kowalevskii]